MLPNNHILSRSRVNTLLIILMTLSSIGSIAQRQISMDEFLSRSSESLDIYYQDLKIEAYENYTQRPSIINRLEFRTETNNFNLKEQEYALRFIPNSIKATTYKKDYNDLEKQSNDIQRSILLKNETLNRYQIILSQVFLKQKLNYLEKMLEINLQKLKVLKTMAQYDLPKINSIIDAEDQLSDIEIKILGTENNLNSLNALINEICNTDSIKTKYELSTEDLIAAGYIRKHYEDIIKTKEVSNIKLERSRLKMKQSILKEGIKSNEDNKLLKYFQIRYGSKEKGFEQDQLSLGIGIIIPHRRSKKYSPDLIEFEGLTPDNIGDKSNYEKELKGIEDDKYDILITLENNISEYEILNNRIRNSLSKKILEKVDALTELKALEILKLREHDLKQEQKLTQVEFDMYRSYIKSVDIFGLIESNPYKNYLSYRSFGG